MKQMNPFISRIDGISHSTGNADVMDCCKGTLSTISSTSSHSTTCTDEFAGQPVLFNKNNNNTIIDNFTTLSTKSNNSNNRETSSVETASASTKSSSASTKSSASSNNNKCTIGNENMNTLFGDYKPSCSSTSRIRKGDDISHSNHSIGSSTTTTTPTITTTTVEGIANPKPKATITRVYKSKKTGGIVRVCKSKKTGGIVRIKKTKPAALTFIDYWTKHYGVNSEKNSYKRKCRKLKQKSREKQFEMMHVDALSITFAFFRVKFNLYTFKPITLSSLLISKNMNMNMNMNNNNDEDDDDDSNSNFSYYNDKNNNNFGSVSTIGMNGGGHGGIRKVRRNISSSSAFGSVRSGYFGSGTGGISHASDDNGYDDENEIEKDTILTLKQARIAFNMKKRDNLLSRNDKSFPFTPVFNSATEFNGASSASIIISGVSSRNDYNNSSASASVATRTTTNTTSIYKKRNGRRRKLQSYGHFLSIFPRFKYFIMMNMSDDCIDLQKIMFSRNEEIERQFTDISATLMSIDMSSSVSSINSECNDCTDNKKKKSKKVEKKNEKKLYDDILIRFTSRNLKKMNVKNVRCYSSSLEKKKVLSSLIPKTASYFYSYCSEQQQERLQNSGAETNMKKCKSGGSLSIAKSNMKTCKSVASILGYRDNCHGSTGSGSRNISFEIPRKLSYHKKVRDRNGVAVRRAISAGWITY